MVKTPHPTAGAGLLSGLGTKILHVTQHDQNNNKNNLRGWGFILLIIRSYWKFLCLFRSISFSLPPVWSKCQKCLKAITSASTLRNYKKAKLNSKELEKKNKDQGRNQLGMSLAVSPVVKNLHFHCREHGFDPWSRNWNSTCYIAWHGVVEKKKKKSIKF